MDYTLNFKKQLGKRELARGGGEFGPLETALKIEFDDDLGDVMSDANKEGPPKYDFLVCRESGRIIPNFSGGKKDKIDLICLLPTFIDVVIGASRV